MARKHRTVDVEEEKRQTCSTCRFSSPKSLHSLREPRDFDSKHLVCLHTASQHYGGWSIDPTGVAFSDTCAFWEEAENSCE
jgi:hypothetical protein